MNILNHPVLGRSSEDEITVYFEGKALKAKKGQTIAAALMANDIKKLGVSRKLRQSRGFYCGTGRCCNCFMTVNGSEHVLTCMALAEDGMRVSLNDEDPDIRGERNGN